MAEPMKIGQKYWVRYKIPGLHRADRTLIALFLGAKGDRLEFSGRPQFGTTDLDKAHVLVMKEVGDHAECHVDRKA